MYIRKEKAVKMTVVPNTNTNYVMKKKTRWMASEEMLWMVKCSTLVLPSTRLHAAVPFRLCRTKQNPDSSPPSRVEWIQYDTECQMFHLAMKLEHMKQVLPSVLELIPTEITIITSENTTFPKHLKICTWKMKKWRGKVNSKTEIPKYKNVYLTYKRTLWVNKISMSK